MNQVIKFLAGFVLALLASSLFAANPSNGVYADDHAGMTKCLADAAASKAVGYVPVTDSEFKDKTFVQKRIGKGGACLSGAYVHEDLSGGAPTGTVFVPEGFLYAEKVDNKGFTLYRMVKCSNPFRGIVVPTFAAAAAPATTSSVAVTTATGAVSVSVTVNNSVTVNAGATTPAATCEADCQAKLAQEKVEKRTDGACVIAFQSSADKTYRFVRFDVKTWEGKPILIGGSVTDATTAKVTGESKMSVVGTGEKNLVYMKPDATGKFDCQAAFRAVSIPQVLAWTGPRLGLTTACRPVTHSGKAS